MDTAINPSMPQATQPTLNAKETIMKTSIVLAAALLAFGSSAFAADAAGGKTRAQVIAELAQAQQSGELAAVNSEDPMAAQLFHDRQFAGPGKTRAQVQAELAQAQKSGELAALNSEDPLAYERFAERQFAGHGKTRAQVQAELAQAQKSGELAALNSEDPMAYPRFVASKARKAETMAE